MKARRSNANHFKEPGKLICEGDENGGVKQSSISNVLLKIKGETHIGMRARFLKLQGFILF